MSFHVVGRFVLVRHGQSTFNARNCFTGWSDPGLTAVGEAESRSVGRSLREAGLHVDLAFCSALRRTQAAADIILGELHSQARLRSSEALNERDYGDLTGVDKTMAVERWGGEAVHRWRRSYGVAPPNGESLRDVVARVAPFYLRNVLPVVLRGRTVLVVSHGNTLRALVSALEGLSAEQVEGLDISTGEALGFEVAGDAQIRRAQLLVRWGDEMARDG